MHRGPARAVVGATIRLLGDPVLVGADGSVKALERRAAGLLALVALEPGTTRARAAALLWPDSDDARRALRQQISRFRKNYGAELLRGEDALSIADGVSVDALAAGDAGGGDLLGELSFDDCQDFAQWLAHERYRRRESTAAALDRMLAQAEAEGDLPQALRLVERLLVVDCTSEAHHRKLMRLHYLRGDIAQAQRVYEELAAMLAHRFGARPSAQTEQLARALREANAAAVQAAAGAMPVQPRALVPVTLQRPPRTIGRTRELAALAAAWQTGQASLLLGEPGLGKSRLLAEFATGRRVVGVQGRPGDAGVPYATLARLLRAILERSGIELEAPRRTELARLLPELAPSVPLPADGQRLLLQSAVQAVLAQARIDRLPLEGLIVDDLHFADDASVEMLQALMGFEPLHGLRWTFAQRPGEGQAAAALRACLEEARVLVPVSLAPLGEHEMVELIDSLGVPELDGTRLAVPLLRHTGGNPLFALATLAQGLADGTLRQGRLPAPVDIGALIQRRLRQLSGQALALARVAAIAGVDFDIALAEHVTGLRTVELADAWAELEAAQVLRGDAFAHDLVHEAALGLVPEVVARRLHGQCAAWLQAHRGEPARMAEHWLRAGETARAGEAFVAAARRAETAARLEEQASLLSRAADAFAAAGLGEPRFEALCERMRARIDLDFGPGGLDEAQALITLAVTDAQRLRALQLRVGLLTERGQSERAVDEGRAGMALASSLGDRAAQLRLACHTATALCRLGRASEALSALLPLRPWVAEQPDPALTMLWHGDWAATLGWLGRMREAASAYDVAIAAARQARLPDAEGRLLLNCAVTLRQSGQFDRALQLSQQGRSLSSADSSDATHRLVAELIIARDESESGLYDSALCALESILPRFETTGAVFWAQACRMVLAQLWLQLGQFARALPLLRDEPAGLPAWLRADRRLLHSELALALHQPDAGHSLDEELALADADGFRGPALRVRSLRGLAPPEVLAQAEALHPRLLANERFGVVMSLHVHASRAALAMAKPGRAADAADALRSLFDEGFAPDSMYRAEAWLVAQQAFEAAGRRADAERMHEQGLDWVRRRALPSVPAPFIDSFLNRNLVNAALLASRP